MGAGVEHRVGGLIAPAACRHRQPCGIVPLSTRLVAHRLQLEDLAKSLLKSIEMAGHRDTRGHGIGRTDCGENLLVALHRVSDHVGITTHSDYRANPPDLADGTNHGTQEMIATGVDERVVKGDVGGIVGLWIIHVLHLGLHEGGQGGQVLGRAIPRRALRDLELN